MVPITRMTAEQKEWIDNATTEELLHKWRFGPVGSEFFTGECGTYYSKVLYGRRDADPAAWTAASKKVGWG